MPKFVRWRPEAAVILIHPETGTPTAPVADEIRTADDPLVKKFPWAFISNEEEVAETATARLAARRLRPEDIAEREAAAGVERATKAPGEKRSTRRKPADDETGPEAA